MIPGALPITPGRQFKDAAALCVLMSEHSHCLRRKVGCVLAAPDGTVLAFGYNGHPAGDVCKGGPPGTCGCLHAEPRTAIRATRHANATHAIITAAPCVACARILLDLGVSRVWFFEDSDPGVEGVALLNRKGVEVNQLDYSYADRTPRHGIGMLWAETPPKAN